MRNIGTDSSTCANVNKNVASGRKTNDVDAIAATNVDVSAGTGGEESAVLVNVGGRGDAIVFSYEIESVPSLDEESDDDDDEDSWNSESEDEEEDVDEEFDELLAERLRILADCRALKNLAEAFLHPEQPVKANPSTFGRNYFDRPSAPAVMDDEDADEEAEILEDVENLKKAAMAYLHPEVGVRVEDATLFGRNYFERPSAPKVDTFEEAEERAKILAEAAALKKLAVDYIHPEVGVRKVDGEMFGRNYFNRYSAPETEEDEFADERAEALAEAAALKKLAVDYLHPEKSVSVEDATLFGRNYFERASAPDVESKEEAEERAKILAEAAALKQLATDYLHPEVGVKTTDPTLFGRNYFNRYSAPETEEDEFADERAEILADAAALKKSAVAYMHPEVGVCSEDATLFGRNYFERASAPDAESKEEAEERAKILAEAAALKKSAVAYMYPEIGVKTTDPTLFGRNYFNRYSAPETEEDEFADERAEILADAAALKKSAVAYMHPEVGVCSEDATLFGRNYFERASAPDVESKEEAEERAKILAEAAALKKSAVAYMHPEVGVKTTDPTLFGRNYFNRYSAPETEEDEFADERAEILADAAALKKSAVAYMHPEVGVCSEDATLFGRNYFERASAPDFESMEEAEERAKILAEAAALKQLATDYMPPEVGVKTTDPTLFGRNYFNRYSAPSLDAVENTPESSPEDAESHVLSSFNTLAATVKGANLPSTKNSKLSSLDKDIGATKKSASTVDLFGLTDEVH